MDQLRLSKGVRRVVLLKAGPSGELTPTVLHGGPDKKKKKQTRALRPLEKAQRRFAKSQRTYWDNIVKRHDRSNAKKRDGWARDAVTNIVKASGKSFNQLGKII